MSELCVLPIRRILGWKPGKHGRRSTPLVWPSKTEIYLVSISITLFNDYF